MWGIKAEDAEIYEKRITEPPKLTELLISPQNPQLSPNLQQAFTVERRDQYGEKITLPSLEWSATGGSITANGILLPGEDEGNFTVTAAANEIEATVTYTIKIEKYSDSSGSPSPKVSEDKSPFETQSGAILWRGEVPAQKWTQFYIKVLTKYATNKDLELNLEVKITVKGDVSEQKQNETKIALQELGLSDEFETE